MIYTFYAQPLSVARGALSVPRAPGFSRSDTSRSVAVKSLTARARRGRRRALRDEPSVPLRATLPRPPSADRFVVVRLARMDIVFRRLYADRSAVHSVGTSCCGILACQCFRLVTVQEKSRFQD